MLKPAVLGKCGYFTCSLLGADFFYKGTTERCLKCRSFVCLSSFFITVPFLLSAGNESCPQPQTSEHLAAIEIMKLKHILILQNKIDLVKESQAKEQYEQILAFVQGKFSPAEIQSVVEVIQCWDIEMFFYKHIENPFT